MSFNFELPITYLGEETGENIEKYRMNRAIEVLSKIAPDYLLGINDGETTNSTMASLIDRSNFPEKFNNSSEILKLAYYIYQRNGYKVINSFLRDNNGLVRGKNEFGETDKIKYSIEDIIDALDYLIESQPKLEEDIILYRAVSGEKDILEEKYTEEEARIYGRGPKKISFEDADIPEFCGLESENFDSLEELIGKSYTNKGYTSSTFKSNSTGASFLNSNMVIAIRVPKGTKILGPFYNFNESEILLGRDYEFKIVGMEYINGKVMVYVGLQPRELEKSSKLLEDIKMPEIEENIDTNIPTFEKPQQKIIEDINKGKKIYQIESKLNSVLESIEKEDVENKLKYQNLKLDYDNKDIMMIKKIIMDISSRIKEGNLSLEQLDEQLEKVSETTESIKENLGSLESELEGKFYDTVGKKIQVLIRDSEINGLEQKVKDIQSRKLTLLEKVFGKDKLYTLMIENYNRQMKEKKEEPFKKYTNKQEIFKDILDYAKEKGIPKVVKDFLANFSDENATEEEKILFEQIMEQQMTEEKKEIYQEIPLFSIGEKTKKIQEELNNHNSEKKQKNLNVEKLSTQDKIVYSLDKCLANISENIKEKSKNNESNNITRNDEE